MMKLLFVLYSFFVLLVVTNATTTINTWMLLGGDRETRKSCDDAESSGMSPSCRYDMKLAMKDTDVYMYGGFAVEYISNQLFNGVWRFDTVQRTWSKLSTSNCQDSSKAPCRNGHVQHVYGDRMFVSGGEQVHQGEYSSDLWSFSLTHQNWTNHNLASRHDVFLKDYGYFRAASAVIGTKMYVYGGKWTNYPYNNVSQSALYHDGSNWYALNFYTDGTVYRSNLYYYDFVANDWYGEDVVQNGNTLYDCIQPGPPCAEGSSMIAYKDTLVTFGGYKLQIYTSTYGSLLTNEVWQYNTTSKVWFHRKARACSFSSTTTPDCRQQHTATFRPPHYMIVVGGLRVNTQSKWISSNDVWQLNLQTWSWTLLRQSACSFDGTTPECHFAGAAVGSKLATLLFGGQSFSAGGQFMINQLWSYRAEPTLQVLPSGSTNGTTSGRTLIHLYGEEFGYDVNDIVVHVKGRVCTNVTLIATNTHVSCLTPAGAGAMVAVQLFVNSSGTWSSNEVHFNYTRPSLTAVGSSGVQTNTDGGYWITINGKEFGTQYDEPLLAYVGNKKCLSVEYVTSESLKCRVPPGVGQGLSVSVTIVNQVAQMSSVFSYMPPTVNGSNSLVVASEGTTNTPLEVYGSNFGGAEDSPRVFVGGVECPQVEWLSSGHLRCVSVPAGTGQHQSITVSVGGQSGTLESSNFGYAGPQVTSVTPSRLLIKTERDVTVRGVNFGSSISRYTVAIGKLWCVSETLSAAHVEILCRVPQVSKPARLPLTVTVTGQVSNTVWLDFVHASIPSGLVATAVVLGVLACCLYVYLLMMVYVNRRVKLIRSSSVPFLVATVVGAMIMTVPLFFLEKINNEPSNDVGCHAGIWCVSIGFTVLYGSMLVKNARILWIFQGQLTRVRGIKNTELAGVLGLALSVDVILLSVATWATDDRCTSLDSVSHMIAFVLILISKCVIVVAGVVIAFKSRVIHVKEFNERHQLGYAFYNVAVCSTFIIPASLLLWDDVRGLFIIRMLAIVLMSVAAILCLFLPKVYRLFNPTPEDDSTSSRLYLQPTSATPTVRKAYTTSDAETGYSVTAMDRFTNNNSTIMENSNSKDTSDMFDVLPIAGDEDGEGSTEVV